MNIQFYKNTSDNIVVDKHLAAIGTTISGNFRENVSVTDPVFTIEDYTGFNPANANYCYIPSLDRYYYINDIKLISNIVYEIHCHVDVLMSYKDGIRGNNAIIARQQSEGMRNLYLNDGAFKTKAYSKYDILKYPSGFSGFYYVLAVAGR